MGYGGSTRRGILLWPLASSRGPSQFVHVSNPPGVSQQPVRCISSDLNTPRVHLYPFLTHYRHPKGYHIGNLFFFLYQIHSRDTGIPRRRGMYRGYPWVVMIILSYHHLEGSILRASLTSKYSVPLQSPVGETLACFESLRSRLELLWPSSWHQEWGPSFLRLLHFALPQPGPPFREAPVSQGVTSCAAATDPPGTRQHYLG